MIVWSSHRAVSVRFALSAIPKKTLPALPKPVNKLVVSELERVRGVQKLLEPIGEEVGMEGWGRLPVVAATDADQRIDMRLVHYRRATAQTLRRIELAALKSGVEGTWRAGRMPVDLYLDSVQEAFGVHPQVMRFYTDAIMRARYSDFEISESSYKDVMRSVVVILKACALLFMRLLYYSIDDKINSQSAS